VISRAAFPTPVKKSARVITRTTGRWTASLRLTPDLIMAGGHRCGTTALTRALMTHPQIASPVLHKGVNYFDIHYARGWSYYQGHFPLRRIAELRAKGTPITMEASGYYLDHPFAPERIGRDLPDVKIVIMLRDPVERAHSAHRHAVARGFDDVSFEEAIEREEEVNAGEVEKMRADPTYSSFPWRHQSSVRRGQYVDRLETFFSVLPREQFLIVFSEEFATQPHEQYASVLSFLGLPHQEPAEFGRWNTRPGGPMLDSTRRRLEEHYAPYDARLAALLGRTLPWQV
jgi:Sulfotransferase domain